MSPREFLTSMIAILTIMVIISTIEILVPLFPPTDVRIADDARSSNT